MLCEEEIKWFTYVSYSLSVCLSASSVYRVVKNQPPPVLSINLDHNAFKCSAPGCTKSFRKAKLLHYHMKYYHGEEKAESMLRNDSLSSDQSESLRPPPPRPYKGKRGGGNKRQISFSSSEEEGGSTPEYTSCEDVEIESVSERGERGEREGARMREILI